VYPGPEGGDRQTLTDSDNNGIYDAIIERSWDAAGLVTFQWDDLGNDGLIDNNITLSYHADGRRSGLTGSVYDPVLNVPAAGMDGYVAVDNTYTYDINGLLVNVHIYADPGNTTFVTELDEVYTWTCAPVVAP
jgi:hypothetical protein